MANRFKTLEDTFDMESAEDDTDSINDATEVDAPSDEDIHAALALANDIDKQLSAARGKDEHDREMDELADLAIKAHIDLQDLGMNVEIRHAGEIFSSSSQMLKIAVDAKHNKIDKKLKMLRLQLDKLKLDRATKKPDDNLLDVKATLMDRNELLKQLDEINRDAK
jgi:hypothetical protein